MNCFKAGGASPSSPIHPIQERGCCNTTAVKTSLLVLGLLLLVAIAAYVSQINAIAVYTMGSLSGLLILGVVITSLVQYVRNRPKERQNEREEIEDLDFQALILGLDVTRLPQDISERRQIIKSTRKAILEKEISKIIDALQGQIEALRPDMEDFRKIIQSPEHSLCDRAYQEKINLFWLQLKLSLISMLDLRNIGKFNQHPTIIQKQQEITALRLQLIQLRQASYRPFVQSLGEEDLLKQAQQYYLQSFYKGERVKIKDSIEQMTLKALLPKLKERVVANARYIHEIVEMQEIISQIEGTPPVSYSR